MPKFERTNAPGFVKDVEHGVVINKNYEEYQRILDKRKHKKELDRVQSEVVSLKKELEEVQALKEQMAEMKEFFNKLKENQ